MIHFCYDLTIEESPTLRIGATTGGSASRIAHFAIDDGTRGREQTGTTAIDQPRTGRYGTLQALGHIRLQNSDELRQCLGLADTITDLEVALRIISLRGMSALPTLIGEFGFVIRYPDGRGITLVRDALGLAPLYYAIREGRILVSSQVLSLAGDDHEYDLTALGDLLVNGANLDWRTTFRGISVVPPGSAVSITSRGVVISKYWSLENLRPSGKWTVADAGVRFRELFDDAVRADHLGGCATWSSLSGGLDSSSIVVSAAALAASGRISEGLAGTVSLFDTIGKSDERSYSTAVAEKARTKNVTLRSSGPWSGFGDGLPIFDQPLFEYLYPDNWRRITATIAAEGGSVYMSGMGADHYMGEDLMYLTDLVARGRLSQFARELVSWSVVKRHSFWQLGYEYAVRPMLPPSLQSRTFSAAQQVPMWLSRKFVRSHSLEERSAAMARVLAPIGSKYHAGVAYDLAHLANGLNPAPTGAAVEMRYPFLYRPLLEFALTLPAELRFRPNAPKFILREAMRGRLPEVVLTRSSKGSTGTRCYWVLKYERNRLERLVDDPILGQLGCVNVDRLRRAFARAVEGRGSRMLPLLRTLALETWLQVRAGIWRDDTNVRSQVSPNDDLAQQLMMSKGSEQPA